MTARPISSVPSNAALIVVLPHLDVPHDVLAHHDRVVDQDADGERQAEQRHRVQREAERPHGDERREHRHRQRQAGDDRRAPRVQEQEHDRHGERRAFEQRLLDARAPSSATRTPASRTTRSVTPAGSVALDLRDRARGSSSATAVVLKPVDLTMSMPTASSSL